mgnify:CR=1 FL=1
MLYALVVMLTAKLALSKLWARIIYHDGYRDWHSSFHFADVPLGLRLFQLPEVLLEDFP